MTVRAWVTLSVLALAALTAAFVVRVVSPIRAPAIVASADGARLPSEPNGSCWPQRGGDLRCAPANEDAPDDLLGIPAAGSLRVFVDFPVQPEAGTLTIVDARGATVVEEPWTNRLRYDLRPGRYVLRARADYDDGAFVAASFALVAEVGARRD